MPRDTLTRDQIVRAAVDLLDEDGIPGLSMRKLGARLGAAATAMYWHVPTKDELVVLAADHVWAEIELADSHAHGWRPAAEAMGQGLYMMVVHHPWLITAMSTHLLYGPGKARYDDHLLGIFEAAGCTPAQADLAATAIVTSTLGMALGATTDAAWRTRLRRAGSSGAGSRSAGSRGQDESHVLARIKEITAGYPRLRTRPHTSLDDLSAGPDPGAGLAVVLDGLATLITDATGLDPQP